MVRNGNCRQFVGTPNTHLTTTVSRNRQLHFNKGNTIIRSKILFRLMAICIDRLRFVKMPFKQCISMELQACFVLPFNLVI